jgi:biopolymer transport protein TolQ
MDSARRAMRATYQREIDALDAHLAGSRPWVGVAVHRPVRDRVGHHECVRGPRQREPGTLAHVAPGIAEALIATAIGLFAAIPAVVAYNRYHARRRSLSVRFETFIEEFSNILQRQG